MPRLRILTILIAVFPASHAGAQPPTPAELYDTLVARGFRDPLAIWRVSMWETGYLKSNICRTKNNLFGIKAGKDYKTFNTWQECVDAMKSLEDRKYKEYSSVKNGDYYDFLAWWGFKTGYSYSLSDVRYVQLIKKISPPKRERSPE